MAGPPAPDDLHRQLAPPNQPHCCASCAHSLHCVVVDRARGRGSLTPGARLRFYEILAPIGSGGMGSAFAAIPERRGFGVIPPVLRNGATITPDKSA